MWSAFCLQHPINGATHVTTQERSPSETSNLPSSCGTNSLAVVCTFLLTHALQRSVILCVPRMYGGSLSSYLVAPTLVSAGLYFRATASWWHSLRLRGLGMHMAHFPLAFDLPLYVWQQRSGGSYGIVHEHCACRWYLKCASLDTE